MQAIFKAAISADHQDTKGKAIEYYYIGYWIYWMTRMILVLFTVLGVAYCPFYFSFLISKALEIWKDLVVSKRFLSPVKNISPPSQSHFLHHISFLIIDFQKTQFLSKFNWERIITSKV